MKEQQEAMHTREITSGIAKVLNTSGYEFLFDQPDIRVGDIVRIILVAQAVPDITYSFYCTC